MLICPANVQHNCAAHACSDSASIPRFAERERIGTRSAIAHREKADLLLNTFQMRNARYIQQLRLEREPLDREAAIFEGAQFEIDTQKGEAQKTGGMSVRRTALSAASAMAAGPSRLSQTTVAADSSLLTDPTRM